MRAGVVEVHRQQGEQVGIAELFLGDAQPFDERGAAGVIPWNAARLCAPSRCLTDDGDTCARTRGVDGSLALVQEVLVALVMHQVMVQEREGIKVSVVLHGPS